MERVVIRATGHTSIALDGRTLVVEIDADSPIAAGHRRHALKPRSAIYCMFLGNR